MSFYRGDGGTGSGDVVNTPLQISQGGTNATTASNARTNLGLGSMATQNSDNVTITGGTIAASAIPSLGAVATSNDYDDLSNKPSIPTDINQLTDASGLLFDGDYNSLSGLPVLVSSLADLSDVTLASSIGTNEVLLYNGSGWINSEVVLTSTGIETAIGDTILTSGDIGVTIQAYDPDILTSADIGVTIQAYDPNILVSGDIGVQIQAYDANLTEFVNTFTLPTADGTVGQVLQTDGSGNLVFASGVAGGGVDSFNGRSGAVTLTSGDVVGALSDTILFSADIGTLVQPYDANILVSGDIGVQIQAYDANLTEFVNTFTLPSADGTNGQVLTTNGSGTLTFASASTVATLNDLTDVVITSASADQILRYNASGAVWVNVPLPSYLPVTKYDTTTVQVTIANGSIPVINRAGGTVNISVV